MVVHHCKCSPYHQIVQFQMVDVMLHEFNFQWQKLKSKKGGDLRLWGLWSHRWLCGLPLRWVPGESTVFGAIMKLGWTASTTLPKGKSERQHGIFPLKKKKKNQVAQCRLLSRVPGQCGHISNHNLQGPFLSSLSPSQTFKSCILNSSCFLWNAVNWLGMTRVSGGE